MSDLHHSVYPMIERSDVTFEFHCDAQEGANCRLVCPEHCEEICTHEKVDGGECNVLNWLYSDSAIDLYSGEKTSLRSGLIKVSWDGTSFDWEYLNTV